MFENYFYSKYYNTFIYLALARAVIEKMIVSLPVTLCLFLEVSVSSFSAGLINTYVWTHVTIRNSIWRGREGLKNLLSHDFALKIGENASYRQELFSLIVKAVLGFDIPDILKCRNVYKYCIDLQMFKRLQTDPKFKMSQTFHVCLYVEENMIQDIIVFPLAHNSGAHNSAPWDHH